MRKGIYREDGMAAEVEILKDLSTESIIYFRLKIIKTIIESRYIDSYTDGEEITAKRPRIMPDNFSSWSLEKIPDPKQDQIADESSKLYITQSFYDYIKNQFETWQQNYDNQIKTDQKEYIRFRHICDGAQMASANDFIYTFRIVNYYLEFKIYKNEDDVNGGYPIHSFFARVYQNKTVR